MRWRCAHAQTAMYPVAASAHSHMHKRAMHTHPSASGLFMHAQIARTHASVPVHVCKRAQARVGGMHVHTCTPWPAIFVAHSPRAHSLVPGRSP